MVGNLYIIEKARLDDLIRLLREDGCRVVGPTIRDGAIVFDEIASAEQLPRGWTDVQEAGHYRLERRTDDAYFGYVVGPYSCKRYLFPPRQRLFSITRNGRPLSGFDVDVTSASPPRIAFLGVRACDLAALEIQDRVFNAEYADPYYRDVRRSAVLIAVNCSEPGGTCFCSSMQTGPRCTRLFDLALTELPAAFAAEAGTERGRALLERLSPQPADRNVQHLVELMLESAAEHMGRALDTRELPEILLQNPEHPHWNRVAERCLACANCTLSCPTCFCSNVEDSTDLGGSRAERWRSWGSCFTLEFSYHTGGFSRSSVRARYRQWLTHKLAGWHEQFGMSGCVGCGRCITWCPVGIDVTKEATTIADDVRRADVAERGARERSR
ncbi:MAG: 4Fe-4S dicluster domain-containing protein [Phycisphaerae bacterium]|nr:4Fe-4S dicluster domain-containing protein [Phycisphaerae bacterium]